jgi:hypothetical protein
MAFKSDGYRTVNEIFQVAADCYVGQVVIADANAGGLVEPVAAAAAGPDTASRIVGCVNSVVTSPTYDSTYKGDLATYDTTQATQVANEPVGAALVRVDVLFPGDIVCFPIVKDTIGTAPERKACTTGSTDGLTFVVATIDTTVSQNSTVYCSKGANRGVARKVTTGATTTQTVLAAFPYDIAVGDEFVIVNLVQGLTKFDFDTQFQGVDSSIPYTSNYYWGFCHQMELQKSGEEKAYITIGARHLAMY